MRCPDCNKEYQMLGKHLAQSSCKYPMLSEKQREIIEGALMGDGHITDENGKKSCFEIKLCSRKFLEWFDKELRPFSKNRLSKIEFEKKNWNNQYKLSTIAAPHFSKIRYRWYNDSRDKVFPTDLELTRLKAKMWYVTDGGISKDKRHNSERAYISCANESDNKQKILNYFDDSDFDPYWAGDKQFYIPASQTKDFLEWLGKPVQGYEYKWG